MVPRDGIASLSVGMGRPPRRKRHRSNTMAPCAEIRRRHTVRIHVITNKTPYQRRRAGVDWVYEALALSVEGTWHLRWAEMTPWTPGEMWEERGEAHYASSVVWRSPK